MTHAEAASGSLELAETDRIPTPQGGDSIRQRVAALREALASPDPLQRLEVVVALDRLERALLAEVAMARRALEDGPTAGSRAAEAALDHALALRALADAGLLGPICEGHVLEHAIKSFARVVVEAGMPPEPVVRLFVETAERRGRRQLAARLRERLLPGGASARPGGRRAAAGDPRPGPGA
ncbi:MAG: hypothetical protein KatS3mg102_0562 [Planctomycetota bacterium]|nr:MAG: hypothetical protein KatS3mg102_0562 [Planctomycetota bacterium]